LAALLHGQQAHSFTHETFMTTDPNFSSKSRTCHLPNHLWRAACLVLATVALAGCREAGPAKTPPAPAAVPVRVDATSGMSRGGKPYFVKGAGGTGSLEQLAARGGNSIRTWNTTKLADILNQA